MLTKNISPATYHPGDTPANAGLSNTTAPTRVWHRVTLALIIVISAFLNFFQQQQNGYGNEFYASAVRSMLDSWHTFFFVAFDPGGFVTVDKPPLGLWIQTASAALLGFSGFSIILPQALGGIISILVLYWLVRRKLGPIAGLLAALFLALTPITVAMSRDNNLDILLVLFLLLATCAMMLAAETGRLRWLLLGALLVAFAFNIKTLEAYMVVPALGLLYLLTAPLSWRKRILHLVLATLVLLIVSFSWIVIVDMVPASQRPFVDSTSDNSELDLTLGYNGIQRLLGSTHGVGSGGQSKTSSTDASKTPSAEPSTPEQGNTEGAAKPSTGLAGGGPGGFGGGAFNGGEPPSALRLFHVELGGQVSWLLPMAILGLLALLWQGRISLPLDNHRQAAVLWGLWLLTMGTFFSLANFFHTYYMVIVAPSIAALAASGLVVLWHDYRTRTDWRKWILPLALVLTVAEQVYLLSSYDTWNTTLTPILLLLTLLSAAILVFLRLRSKVTIHADSWLRSIVVVGAAALLITPAIWSTVTTLSPENTELPTAGPSMSHLMAPATGSRASGDQQDRPADFMGIGMAGDVAPDPKLVSYLLANQGKTRYLLATTNSKSSQPIIIQTNKPVMSLGGFIGSDPILTQDQLISLIKNNTIRYFLLPSTTPGNQGGRTMTGSPAQEGGFAGHVPGNGGDAPMGDGAPGMRGNGGGAPGANQQMGGGGGMGGGAGANQQLISWVQAHCSTVPSSLWNSSTTQSAPHGGGAMGGGSQQLYDCATQH
ncbi:MAG TPA: glycosyltransferase family 39 protein [Ktedonobacteraceae bacterium]|nr:glycosyltransferase family 39 protein [Ktedonobacteraceae bacterium]